MPLREHCMRQITGLNKIPLPRVVIHPYPISAPKIFIEWSLLIPFSTDTITTSGEIKKFMVNVLKNILPSKPQAGITGSKGIFRLRQMKRNLARIPFFQNRDENV